MNLNLAGINLSIENRSEAPFVSLPESYRDFIVDSQEGSLVLPVTLETAAMPDLNHFERLFSTDDSWSFYHDRGSAISYVVFCPPACGNSPLWIARFPADLSEVAIFCSQEFVLGNAGGIGTNNPFCYPLDQILLMYILSRHEGILVHTAGCKIEEKAYIFAGKSGTGKSTIARLIHSVRDMERLSDDRIAVRKIDGVFRAFGTPWPGTEGVSSAGNAPLHSIFFLSKGETNSIYGLTTSEAIKRLIPLVSIPWYDRPLIERILPLCEDLVNSVPAYDLSFRPDQEIGKFLEKFLVP